MPGWRTLRGSRLLGPILGAAVALATSAGPCLATPPPTDVRSADEPFDDGSNARIEWSAASDADRAGFRVYRRQTSDELGLLRRDARVEAAEAAFDQARASGADQEAAIAAARQAAAAAAEAEFSEYAVVGVASPEDRSIVIEKLEPGQAQRFWITSFDIDGSESSMVEVPTVVPEAQYFVGSRAWYAVFLFGVCATIVGCIAFARSGRALKVRRIAGLDAIEEAVGRATEMGRPVLYIPGIQDMDEVQTVAGVTILGRVAKVAADYDARIEVPTSRSLVMTACRDAVQTAYYEAGRPEAYNPDLIRYITDEQFGFTAFVAGRMVRERPATCIYMGQFYAESLLLSETGNSINAIQVAGTAESSQLPFFVAACDYTLIGEEFFAASAYLSGEPIQLGSLLGQDIGKMAALLVILLGVALATLGSFGSGAAESAAKYLAGSMLSG